MRERPTQSLIAEKVGVSQMTVSRALRGESGIGEDLSKRICQVAKQLGYPLPAVRRPSRRGAFHGVMCAVIVTDDRNSQFAHRLLDGIERGARDGDSQVMTCNSLGREWPLVALRRQVDGLIIVSGDEHNKFPPLPCPVPAVYTFFARSTADVVSVDNFDGCLALGECLARHGHRTVAFVGPDTHMARERVSGLRAGLELHGGWLPPELTRLRVNAMSLRSAQALTDELLDSASEGGARRDIPFSAVAVYNDYMAASVVERLQQRGLRVPEDVSVVGFDNVAPKSYSGPKLTTFDIPVEEIGAESARLLHWRLDHPGVSSRKLILSGKLVEGQSVADVAPPPSEAS